MALFQSGWDTKSSNEALVRNSVPSIKPKSGKKNQERRDSTGKTGGTLAGNGEGGTNIDLDKLLKKMSDISGGELKAKGNDKGKGKGQGNDRESGRKAKSRDKGSKEGTGSVKPKSGGAQGGGTEVKKKDKGIKEMVDAPMVEAVAGEKRKAEEGEGGSKTKSKKQRKKERAQEKAQIVKADLAEPIVTEVEGDEPEETSELQKLVKKNLQGSKFRHQTKSWPSNPVDLISTSLSTLPPRSIIVDLGCGDAQLAKTLVPQGLNVLSFDLVSDNKWVIEADICTRVPLPGSEDAQSEGAIADACVCSLSLMSTNWIGCAREAWRVLRMGGRFVVAEVTSRFRDSTEFCKVLSDLGFELVEQSAPSTHFLLFEFRKVERRRDIQSSWETVQSSAEGLLKPCEYKRRAPLTFTVPAQARVADLKTAIAEQCPGQPRPNGQRIIWKGRVVVDEEVVGDIWEPGEDTHTVHLAVHPSAWSTPPKTEEPQHASTASTTSSTLLPPPTQSSSIPIPLLSSLNQPTLPTPAGVAKEIIMFHHKNALRVMAGQPMEPWSSPTGLDQASATHWAFMGLVTAGQTFPPILHTSYPPQLPNESGLEYSFVTIDGRPYLSLQSPDASPTPTQQHAIQVLTSTLALIPYLDNLTPLPPILPPIPYTFQPILPPPRQSTRATVQRLRRLIIALRTLVPLSFTLLRASLFIVFFPQAREPLWLTVIIAVVLYEARLIINRANEALPNLPNPDPNDPNPRQGPVANRNGQTNNPLSVNLQTVFDRATLSGVDSEAAQLDLDVPERELRPVPENETPVHEWALRVRSFVLLLGVTLVPAAWARRREALRLREGRMRVVYGERANAVRVENEEGQEVVGMLGEKRIAALRPGGWRRSYVERVLEGIEEHVE
ncbi:unnamed protein product [Rhizoctonia solani]|uniref:Ribosomal RNA-processing protein 8 n=1 Tax=Rhizoctonia solani TaxID=456999 RepID=A0A8H2XF28_9AGAM|nr:unnamed protein product [Rhizoctonia solani]